MRQFHIIIGLKHRWSRRLWFTLFAGWLFLHASAGLALDPAKSVFQYNCRTWKRQDGLPANGVNAIAQTKDGYLWLGTIAGPVRFNGINFELIDLGSLRKFRATETTSLSASSTGGLWVGINNGGVAFIEGKNVSLLEGKAAQGMIPSISSLVEGQGGDLFVSARGQGGRVTGGTNYEIILPPPGTNTYYDVRTAYQDSQGRVWFGTTKAGLYCWQEGRLSKFPDPALDETVVGAVVVDHQGVICVGTQTGLIRYDPQYRKLPVVLSTSEISSLLVDHEGVLWAGTSGGGLLRCQGGNVTQFGKSDGLADDFVTALAEDREGSMWIGTRNGLSQLSDVKIPIFGKTEGLPEVSISLAPSRRGGIWMAASIGLTYYGGGTNIHTYGSEIGLSNTYVMYVLEAKNGDIYLANGGMEILVFSGGKIVARYPNKTWPTALTEDAEGVVAAVDGKLYRVNTNSMTPLLLANGEQAAPGYLFNMIPDKDGSIWIANANLGIVRLKDGSMTNWVLGAGSNDPPGAFFVHEDEDGTVWASATTGIARLKNGRLRMITQKDGLLDNVVYAMVPDNHGRFWLDSARGIVSVTRKALDDFADGKADRVECAVYDDMDDVKSVERNQQKLSGCKSLDGRIWFPMAQGVMMIDPTHIGVNQVPAQVHIEVARVNGQELGKSGGAALRPGKGELEFEYVGLSYIAPLKIQYRYKLNGYDKDWVNAGNRRSAFYTNLKPGSYRFEVQAGNEDSVWNTEGAEYSVQLRPHFYQTNWFYLLCAGAALAFLAGFFNWRVRHLKRKQRALQEAATRLENEVAHRTAELAKANASLQLEEADLRKSESELKRSESQLKQKTQSLESEIEERKRVQQEVEKIHKQLMDASRQAGMAEVATSVLHNVGNVLNSVNISSSIVSGKVRNSKVLSLAKAVNLIETQKSDLGRFLTDDPRGRQLPAYLSSLATHLREEREEILKELVHLTSNIEHIKEIVAMQQSYGRSSGVLELHKIIDLVEDALRMNAGAMERHQVEVIRDFQQQPEAMVDKHKILQILVNLIRNAKYALDDGMSPVKQMTLRVSVHDNERVQIAVMDNGIGIPPDNLTRIFGHGFTTRKEGHGYGLHSGALAARELGGTLTVHSEGHLKGAAFILEIPCKPLLAAAA